jgi:hypothetical protein
MPACVWTCAGHGTHSDRPRALLLALHRAARRKETLRLLRRRDGAVVDRATPAQAVRAKNGRVATALGGAAVKARRSSGRPLASLSKL